MNTKLKRFALSASIVFGIIVLLCTIISRTIYNMLLPEVELTSASPNVLKSTVNINGVFTPSEPVVVKKDSALLIKELFVEQGDEVQAGDALFSLNTSVIDSQLRQLDINIQRQTNDINGNVYSGGDLLVKQMELGSMQAERQSLNSRLPKARTVTAPNSGIVDLESVDALKNEFMYIYPLNTPLQIKFNATSAELAAIKSSTTQLSIISSSTAGKETLVSASYVSSKSSSSATGYEVIVAPASEIEGVLPGEAVKLKMTSSGEIHPLTVPLSAVQAGMDSEYIFTLNQRYSLWGVEDYVQLIKVKVDDSNHALAAITLDSPLDYVQIVRYSSKPLNDGDTVKIKE